MLLCLIRKRADDPLPTVLFSGDILRKMAQGRLVHFMGIGVIQIVYQISVKQRRHICVDLSAFRRCVLHSQFSNLFFTVILLCSNIAVSSRISHCKVAFSICPFNTNSSLRSYTFLSNVKPFAKHLHTRYPVNTGSDRKGIVDSLGYLL